jgi:proteasome lid subunit RPN8/RPN11
MKVHDLWFNGAGFGLDREIFVERAVVDSILSYARMLHPRESILLLKGKVDKHKIIVNDVQIPPLATHGNRFSSFPLSRLPIDFSVIGVAHSHPSGALRPSVADLNKFYGRIMLITAYPYQSEQNMILLDREGKPLKYVVV